MLMHGLLGLQPSRRVFQIRNRDTAMETEKVCIMFMREKMDHHQINQRLVEPEG